MDLASSPYIENLIIGGFVMSLANSKQRRFQETGLYLMDAAHEGTVSEKLVLALDNMRTDKQLMDGQAGPIIDLIVDAENHMTDNARDIINGIKMTINMSNGESIYYSKKSLNV